MPIKNEINPEFLSVKKHSDLFKVFSKEGLYVTPKGHEVIIPNDIFNKYIKSELRNFNRIKNQNLSTLNKLVMSLDMDTDAKRELIDQFLKYLTTDLLFYRVSRPESLCLLQSKFWDSAISYFNDKLDTHWKTTENIAIISQPKQSLLKTRKYLEKLNVLDLVVMYSILKLSGSCVISILCKLEKINYKHAWELSFLEELWYHRNMIKDDQNYSELVLKRSDLKINVQLLSSLR